MAEKNVTSMAIEQLTEDIRAQEESVAVEEKRMSAMNTIVALIEDEKWDDIARLIATFEGRFGSHDLISCTSLRSNKPFLKSLMQTIVPEAEEIEPYPNGVAFKINGIDANFDFCVPFYFSLDVPFTYLPDCKGIYVSAAIYDRSRMEELEADWEKLVADGLIDGSFGYTGNKSSNNQTREFFEYAAPDYAHVLDRFTIINRLAARMSPAKFAWKTKHQGDCYCTVFHSAFSSIEQARGYVEMMEPILDNMKKWDATYELLEERTSRFGFKLTSSSRNNSAWEAASEAKKKRMIDDAEASIATAREFVKMWEGGSVMYRARIEWLKSRKEGDFD